MLNSRLIRRVLPLSALLALSGCLTPVGIATPVDVALVPFYGKPDIRDLGPEPTSYKQLVEAYMIPRLFDQATARYTDWSGPGRGWIGDHDNGYAVYVTIEDKDLAGEYSKPQHYEFIVRDDRIIKCRRADYYLKFELDCPPALR